LLTSTVSASAPTSSLCSFIELRRGGGTNWALLVVKAIAGTKYLNEALLYHQPKAEQTRRWSRRELMIVLNVGQTGEFSVSFLHRG
jgi:hypothetical protein